MIVSHQALSLFPTEVLAGSHVRHSSKEVVHHPVIIHNVQHLLQEWPKAVFVVLKDQRFADVAVLACCSLRDDKKINHVVIHVEPEPEQMQLSHHVDDHGHFDWGRSDFTRQHGCIFGFLAVHSERLGTGQVCQWVVYAAGYILGCFHKHLIYVILELERILFCGLLDVVGVEKLRVVNIGGELRPPGIVLGIVVPFLYIQC
mmetsp:Transcript_31809/g.70656  ORF Transcript_31809/g.70656 Transcript_31809/m.70656 type:complete len:202 (-) Transcript_31809:150-755(-)